MQQQIVLNEEYQNKLREEIEQQQPFISDFTDTDILKAEYSDNFKFGDCFEELKKRYKHVRRLRRDGNCFYRAYLFQVFENFVQNTGTKEDPWQYPPYEKFLKVVEGSKQDLMQLGYDEIAIEDFYDLFVS